MGRNAVFASAIGVQENPGKTAKNFPCGCTLHPFISVLTAYPQSFGRGKRRQPASLATIQVALLATDGHLAGRDDQHVQQGYVLLWAHLVSSVRPPCCSRGWQDGNLVGEWLAIVGWKTFRWHRVA